MPDPDQGRDCLPVIVLIDFGLMQFWNCLINVPKNDLTIHCATGEDNRLSRMPSDFSDAVGNLNVDGRLLGIERSSEWSEDADYRLMFAPGDMISLSVSDRQRGTV